MVSSRIKNPRFLQKGVLIEDIRFFLPDITGTWASFRTVGTSVCREVNPDAPDRCRQQNLLLPSGSLSGPETHGVVRHMAENNNGMKTATFGAGCFWGVEAAFRKVKGVTATAVGYMGGTLKNPYV